MSAYGISPRIYVFIEGCGKLLSALQRGERCEIDEAMFVHWLETSRHVTMARRVVLSDRLMVQADFVVRFPGSPRSLLAFWHRCETEDLTDRRYFVQAALGLR